MRTSLFLICLSFAAACGGGGGNTGGGGSTTTTTGSSTTTGTTTESGSTSTGCGALVSCDGVCVQAASCAFSVTSVDPASGPINGGNFVTLHGHGFAKGLRVDLADGRAVVRVLDDHTALVQPPPGPHQAVDVKVTLAGTSAVLPGGYRYRSATLGATWEKKQMATPRGAYPGLALLHDGRMLIVGGTGDASLVGLTTADLYDPSKDAVVPAKGELSVGRVEPAVVTLMTGKALVVSAWAHPTAVAELFDPATDTFAKSASSLVTARTAAIASLLVDGRVLVMSHETPSAEIYDPDADTFTPVDGAPVIGDFYDQPWPVRLRDGRVLVVKGSGRQSYLFDPDTDTFTPTGNGPAMVVFAGSPREGALQLAPDGRVFAVGGILDPIYTPTSTIAVFDPEDAAAGFTPFAQPLTHAREAAGVTLLNDGEIIAIGGNTDPSPQARSCQMTFAVSATVDVIDPAGTVSAFPALPEPNWTLSAAPLLDGSLIAVGGMTCGGAVAYPYLYFLRGTPVN